MLTLAEVLQDAADSPGFENVGAVDVGTIGSEGQTPLHWMAVLGDVPAIHLLVNAGANVDAQDAHGDTALHEALKLHHIPAARALLENGARSDLRNKQGLSPADLGGSSLEEITRRHRE